MLRKYSHPTAMSKYGQAQVKNTLNIDTHYIPHGIKTQEFYPLPDDLKAQVRAKYSREVWAYTNKGYHPFPVDLNNRFVVGCVARNQPRKNMDRTMKAFCKFAQNKDDVMLLLHADPDDVSSGYHLQEIAHRYGQGHKVWWTGMKWYCGWPQSKMNHLYNLFDTHLLLTSGEGFGIPILEAMSAGVPNITTDYTTTRELVVENNAGYGVRLLGHQDDPEAYPAEQMLDGTAVGTFGVERAFASINHANTCLQALYDDWHGNRELSKRFGKNGRAAAVEKYDWDSIVSPAWMRRLET